MPLETFSMPSEPQVQERTVLVVGGGPVGLFLSLLLARANVAVTLLEAEEKLDDGPRAIAQAPFVLPELKKAGILEDVMAASGELKSTSACFRKTSDKEIVAAVPQIPGKPGSLILPQHAFSQIVFEHLQKYHNAEILLGHRLEYLDTSAERIRATVQTTSGTMKTFSAKYLIGADGGRSKVRALSSIPFEGITLPQQLVATDVYYPFESHGFIKAANFMADPENYGLIGPIDSTGLWRVSFAVPSSLSTEEIEASIPEKFEAMFPGPRPLKYTVHRVAPYKAQQLCAKTFKQGKVLLLGDAAHLTNPYAGMGLTSGILDASSLALALQPVLQRSASEKLLDSWAEARRNVFSKIVDPVSRAAFWSLQDADVGSLSMRHPLLKMLRAGPGFKPPSLATDVTTLEGWVAA